MQKFIKIISIVSLGLLAGACEDVIKIEVPKNEEKLVVDAQINDADGPQTIKLMRSQAYFDNSDLLPISDAKVWVKDSEQNIFTFNQRLDKDGKPGIYWDWLPTGNEKLGKVGRTYELHIDYKGDTYLASSLMKPVPKIDSLIFVYKDQSDLPGDNDGKPKIGYRPEFFARDLTGPGDCYFIKGKRWISKDKKWNQDRTQIAYDAAFQPGARADGLTFILPIRRAITDNLLQEGDSMRVELFSISEAHFDFLRAADQDANNQGLFATPPATFPTNVVNQNKSASKKALGWFSASSKSSLQVYIDPKKAQPDTD